MNIKQIREEYSLSQAELGRILGITGNTVARLERGEKIVSKPLYNQIAAVTHLIKSGLFFAYVESLMPGEYEEYRRKFQGYK